MRYQTLFIVFLMFTISACTPLTKRHATQAILFADENKDGEYTIVKSKEPSYEDYTYSSNPVFISSNSKFSIKVDSIYPGWLYQEAAKKSIFEGKNKDPISHEIFNHLRGKQLWLLTTITSLNTKDPLETNSKRYFKATNVKLESEAFSLLPLDADEKYIFTHESDSSYRVVFQLYEVEGLAVKRELAKISRNPGIIGASQAIFTTLKNTTGALLGDYVQSRWNELATENLALERFLLAVGATEEFHAEITILRGKDFSEQTEKLKLLGDENITKKKAFVDEELLNVDELDISQQDRHKIKELLLSDIPKPFKKNSYLVVDYFKSGTDSLDIKIPKDYLFLSEKVKSNTFKVEDKCLKTDKNETDNTCLRKHGFINFTVNESFSAKSFLSDDQISSNTPATLEKLYLYITALKSYIADDLGFESPEIKSLKNKIDSYGISPTEEEQSEIKNLNKAMDTLQSNILDKRKTNKEKYENILKNIESLDLTEWKNHMQRSSD